MAGSIVSQACERFAQSKRHHIWARPLIEYWINKLEGAFNHNVSNVGNGEVVRYELPEQ